MSTYIIESIGEPTRYWQRISGYGFWTSYREAAAVFTEAERTSEAYQLPEGGRWVWLDGPATDNDNSNAGEPWYVAFANKGRPAPDLGLGKLTINDLAALRRIVIDVVASGDPDVPSRADTAFEKWWATEDYGDKEQCRRAWGAGPLIRGGWDLRNVQDGERLWSAVCQRIMAEAAPMVEGMEVTG